MKWTESYRLGAAETDINSIASPTSLLRYMQDCSSAQMAALGPSYEELFDKGLSFVLSKTSLRIYGTIGARDSFEVETWACASRGVTFNRCYRILKGGETVAEASTVWALVDTQAKKLCRVSDVTLNYGTDEPLDMGSASRFRIPSDVLLSPVGERLVEYADCDLNGHMNNTRYADVMCSYIGDMRSRRVCAVNINYVTEARLGEKITICVCPAERSYYVRTTLPDGRVNAEAEIILEETGK